MPTREETLRDLISNVWKKGRENGLSDEEILAIIERAVAESKKERKDTRRKKRYSYTPMSEEEIRASQEKLGFDNQGRTVRRTEYTKPVQALYGPPPLEEIMEYGPPPLEDEIVQPKAQQELYGPPPLEEMVEYGPPPLEDEIVQPKAQQELYGPPPVAELYEMFEEDQSGKGGARPKHLK